VPREESLGGRSKCPNCDHTITAIENVPVFSYLFLRGRCRHCGWAIPKRYPLIEATTAVLFMLAAWRFEAIIEAAVFALFFWVLVVLTVIDLDYKLLPNRIVYPAWGFGLVALTFAGGSTGTGANQGALLEVNTTFWVGFAATCAISIVMFWPQREPAEDDITDEELVEEKPVRTRSLGELLIGIVALFVWMLLLGMSIADGGIGKLNGAIIGAALFSGLLFAVGLIGSAIAGRAAMGGGDIKLALVLGAFLGYLEAPGIVLTGIFLAILSGGLRGMYTMLRGGGRRDEIPFGPFLAFGTILAVLVGDRLLDWYLGGVL
jgi:leader peptidase (prepilin peptidase)/N-methyltransferase